MISLQTRCTCVGQLSRINVPLSECQQQQQIESKFVKMYRRFFFCDDLTQLDLFYESNYLKEKAYQFLWDKKDPKNENGCIYTIQNYKRERHIENFHNRNLEYYDDFAPIMKVS